MACDLTSEMTLDLVDELVRRLARAGSGGRVEITLGSIEIEHDRTQRAIKLWVHGAFSRSELARFDPPELLEIA